MDWLFGSSLILEAELTNTSGRAHRTVLFSDREDERLPVYGDGEPIEGRVHVVTPKSAGVEHDGLTVELTSVIELYPDRGNPQLVSRSALELAPPGKIAGDQYFPFTFSCPVELDSYSGTNVRVRFRINVTLQRSGISGDSTKELEFLVENTSPAPDPASTPRIHMEVGIEEYLHIEFEYERNSFHLDDVVTGKVFFGLVDIPIKHMEVAILRRETCMAAGMVYTEAETLGKYEVMDGAPVKDEVIPIRVFLTPYALGTSMEWGRVFHVRYFISLVLVDQDDRRYFKQHEIKLWRRKHGSKGDRPRGGATARSLSHDVASDLGSPAHLAHLAAAAAGEADTKTEGQLEGASDSDDSDGEKDTKDTNGAATGGGSLPSSSPTSTGNPVTADSLFGGESTL